MPKQVYLCSYCKKTRHKSMIELRLHHDKHHKDLPWPQLDPQKLAEWRRKRAEEATGSSS